MFNQVLQCLWCGKTLHIKANTPNYRQKYCSDAHRLAAWRFGRANPGVTVWGRLP